MLAPRHAPAEKRLSRLLGKIEGSRYLFQGYLNLWSNEERNSAVRTAGRACLPLAVHSRCSKQQDWLTDITLNQLL